MNNADLLNDYTRHLRAERGLSALTVRAYTCDLLQYSEVLELHHATLLTADTVHVAAHMQHLATHGIRERARARKLASLRGLYRWLVRNERLDRDPTRLQVAPKQEQRLPRALDRKVTARMLEISGRNAEAPNASPQAIRNHAILATLYGAGVRVSELCAMTVAGLNLDELHPEAIVTGKGRKERIVPLGDAAVSIANYLAAARPLLAKSARKSAGAVFLSEQGRAVSRQWVWDIVKRAGGDDHVYPHKLRHSCATDMMRGDGNGHGADIRVVQELLGHANLGTTQIYTRVVKDHLHDAHARFHPRG